jgi:hypothetical protein
MRKQFSLAWLFGQLSTAAVALAGLRLLIGPGGRLADNLFVGLFLIAAGGGAFVGGFVNGTIGQIVGAGIGFVVLVYFFVFSFVVFQR